MDLFKSKPIRIITDFNVYEYSSLPKLWQQREEELEEFGSICVMRIVSFMIKPDIYKNGVIHLAITFCKLAES